MSTQPEFKPPILMWVDREEKQYGFPPEPYVQPYIVFDAEDGKGERRYTAEQILLLEQSLVADGG